MINDGSESDDDPIYIKTLEMDIKSMSNKTHENLKTVLDKHPSICKDDWDTLKGIKAKSTVKPDHANLKIAKVRQVPYASKVEILLDKTVS